ncbi:MAG: TraR/DksA C4-type zinc finger protein [Patescibacteria group bacterium]
MIDKTKRKREERLLEEIKKFTLKKDLEETKLRKRLQSLDVPTMKTHPAELDSTYTNEADGSQERIKTFNHVIKRCYDALNLLRADMDNGICEECGNPISPKRLREVPFTRHCIDCKTEKEAEIKRRTRPGAPRQTSVTYDI